jgi:type I restriction enzyme, S subunit
MSGMNFLKKLLDVVAVEWRSFGEVAKVQRGASPRPISKYITDDRNGIPWIKIGDTSPNSKYVENTEQKITPEGAAKSRVLKKGDFIMSNSMSFGRPYILNIDGAIHDGWASISGFGDRLNADYLYHYLSSNLVQNYWISKINSGSVSNLNSDIIKSLEIPIPPLEIQAEIVRILDTFTELTAELTAELSAELGDRQKQYNYYRDRLLSFEKGEVEWKTLGEVAKIQRGASPRPIAKYITDNEDGVPWIKIGDTSPGSKYVNSTAQRVTLEGAKKSRILNEGDFIISNSMSFGRPYILGIRGAIHDGWASISDFGEKLNSDYLYHYLSSNSVQNYWIGKINSGSVSNLNADIIKTLQIPIPALSEQVRIASLLDKFDTLTTDLREGLPREIALRQQQYEYYRDLLLTFPKPEAVEV